MKTWSITKLTDQLLLFKNKRFNNIHVVEASIMFVIIINVIIDIILAPRKWWH